ncbi:MAG: hypothetical protein CL931_13595, partial [Deltaproteobacteria bacterium]|nr:hypothetical protein [Deltaproteobacteria bacterium]
MACSNEDRSLAIGSDESGAPSVRFPTQDIFGPDYTLIERESPGGPNASRNAYFGDLHVHTTYSFDAFAFGTIATPADAYRYARGEVIRHPGGFDVQLRQPLDFYAVTDHAMFMGAARSAADTSSELSKFDFAEGLHDLNAPGNINLSSVPRRIAAFSGLLPKLGAAVAEGRLD